MNIFLGRSNLVSKVKFDLLKDYLKKHFDATIFEWNENKQLIKACSLSIFMVPDREDYSSNSIPIGKGVHTMTSITWEANNTVLIVEESNFDENSMLECLEACDHCTIAGGNWKDSYANLILYSIDEICVTNYIGPPVSDNYYKEDSHDDNDGWTSVSIDEDCKTVENEQRKLLLIA